MKHGKGVTASFQARDLEKMKFKATFENMYTDDAIRAIENAKILIKHNQAELKKRQDIKEDN